MPGSMPRRPSIRAGLRAGHPIPHAQSAGPTRLPRTPSRTTVTRRVTRGLPGRADLQALSSIDVRRSCRNRVAAMRLEFSPTRNLAILEVAPQRNAQAPRERDNPDASQALATLREACVKPLTQLARRLEA